MDNLKNIINPIVLKRIEKFNEIKKSGLNPFDNEFTPNIISSEIKRKYIKYNYEELSRIDDLFLVAGRIVNIRIIGKIGFLKIQDYSGKIQLFLDKNFLDENIKILKMIDVGDFIGSSGSLMKTKSGEISIKITSMKILTKSLRPLPGKFHGLKEVEQRYRYRYLDLIMDENIRNIFINRTKIIREIQRFLDNDDFIEVETPILMDQAGGANALPFLTYHNSLSENLNLRIATELHLKRLVVGGIDRVYEIGRLFRNEGISTKHNPEFTTVEFYKAYSNYEDLMILTENMLQSITKNVFNKYIFEYNNNYIDFSDSFRRISIAALVSEHLNYNETECNKLVNIKSIFIALELIKKTKVNPEEALQICFDDLSDLEIKNLVKFNNYISNLNISFTDKVLLSIKDNEYEFYEKLGKDLDDSFKDDPDRRRRIALHLLYSIFEKEIECKLIQPTFVTGFSVNVSPLARSKKSDKAVVDRFEFFCGGMEIANAFSELTDPIEQKLRFEFQLKIKNRNDKKNCDIDNDFIRALEHGMPPTAGEGIGIDRLVMLLTDNSSIKEVILFPKMRIK